jgi:UDP-2-acetamido-3-amino-2,3-dideoxy-glucuronate N-acetyltransferase
MRKSIACAACSPNTVPHMAEVPVEVRVDGVQLLELPLIGGDNGSLIVAELGAGMPFAAERIFTLFGVPAGEARGIHAHKSCQQFLVCMTGSVTAVVDDGSHRQEFVLDRPTLGLYMPALTWGTQYNYSADAMLVVLASERYDAADYLEDYDEFVALRAAR